jgi:hypothetical protein
MPGTPRLARIARITARILAGLSVFLLAIVLVLFLVNSFDVTLTPQAKALLTAPSNPFPANQNIYFAMAGLEGSEERPIIEMGEGRIAAYDKALDSMLLHPETASDLEKQWHSRILEFSGELTIAAPRTGSIWADTKNHRQDIEASLAANQRLYQRYLALPDLKGYYETARPSFLAPVIFLSPSLRQLFLADVANRIQIGTLQERRDALLDLQRDIQVWQKVMRGDGSLISKMLSIAWLHSDLILVGDLITDPSLDLKPLDDLLDTTLTPWDMQDYRLGTAYAAEYRARSALYSTILAGNELVGSSASSSWPNRIWNAIQSHFFKPTATENWDAEVTERRIALADSAPSEYERNRKAYEDWLEKDGPHLSAADIYNPMGKILVSLAAAQEDTYTLRAFDVAAYQRLVYLVFQFKRQHIAPANVAAFMTAHPDWATHPVDGKPFHWDETKGEIAVNTLGDRRTEQRFSINLR